MRSEPSVLHVDLDAFFAAVEQRDKPSLRGRPVIVGGLGPRGVVATASYEARQFGVRSAMRMAEARARCPHAAFLSGRFAAYRRTSETVLAVLQARSPLVEPLSLDEAFVDLSVGAYASDLSVTGVHDLGRALKDDIRVATGGLTASVGIGTSKLVAKIASDLDKPDGLVVVAPGTERALLGPMPIDRIPGVGPASRERLRRIGVTTIADADRAGEDELVAILGEAHGHSLALLTRAEDDRAVVPEREAKSVSIEDTFDHDIADPVVLGLIVDRLATSVGERLVAGRMSGRTVTVKVRLFDFTTHSRSTTLAGPTDDTRTVTRVARRLLAEVDTSAGARLLGVGVSGLADWVQDDLFTEADDADSGLNATTSVPPAEDAVQPLEAVPGHVPEASEGRDSAAVPFPRWVPGADVVHADLGRGWVWGSGLGRVTVRFETAESRPGPVRTFRADDAALAPWSPPDRDHDGVPPENDGTSS